MDVAEVRVGVLSASMKLIAEPIEAKRTPQDMQFSMPFGAAVALTHGRASLDRDGMPNNPQVEHVMERVQCVTDPKLDALSPRQMPAWAEVLTTDGRTLRSESAYPKGDPENPVTWDEMSDVRQLAALLATG